MTKTLHPMVFFPLTVSWRVRWDGLFHDTWTLSRKIYQSRLRLGVLKKRVSLYVTVWNGCVCVWGCSPSGPRLLLYFLTSLFGATSVVPQSLPSPCICESRCSSGCVILFCSMRLQLFTAVVPSPHPLFLTAQLAPVWRRTWRAFLVVQWLESTCQWKGHRFELWTGKLPHAVEQQSPGATTTEPVFESLCAVTAEAWVPRLLSPTLELELHTREVTTRRSPHTAAKVTPTCRNERKPAYSEKDPMQPKIIKLKKKDMDPFSYFTTYPQVF